MKTDKIYLVGFMAAGKSTVARALARRIGWEADDIDVLIEARERRSISEIFARQGEPYFRAVEREILQMLLPLRNLVVATGGGTFAEPENRTAINLDGTSIWIDVPFDEVVARLPADPRRPLASDKAQLERLYNVRKAAYQQAHFRVEGAGIRTEQLVDRIMIGLEA